MDMMIFGDSKGDIEYARAAEHPKNQKQPHYGMPFG
jgi:hypothetical protein